VPREQRARAIALMFGGLTTANVLGVPLGTLLGQAAGWRATFWTITAIGVVAFVGISLLVPAERHGDGSAPTRVRHELAALRTPQVWFSIALTVLGYGGMFGAFTYIAYTLTQVAGFPDGAVPWLLVVFGVGLFAGNLLGGRWADRDLLRTLGLTFAALALVLVGFSVVAGSQVLSVVALLLMGFFGFATVPGLQMRVMAHAAHAPTLASGANIAAFNVGNALGAWIGGLTLAAGLGFRAPLWAGAGLTLVALAVLLLAARSRGGELHRAERVPAVPAGGVGHTADLA
jgi:DHA1 family inner membrane transport protein